jgi:outer membrane protein assembly factor BamD
MSRSITVLARPQGGSNEQACSYISKQANRFRAVFGAALLAALVAVAGCGAPPPLGEIELFEEANNEFERGRFSMAASHYQELLEQHPFSDLAEVARLRIAHAYYLNHNFDRAIAAFDDFERLHPASPLMGFVEYSIGMSHLDQIRPADRDKSAAQNALRQFKRVRDRYAGSLYGRLANFRIGECEEILASHELVIGDYYRRVGKLSAGRQRYGYLVETYPNTDAAVLGRQRLAFPPTSDVADNEPTP